MGQAKMGPSRSASISGGFDRLLDFFGYGGYVFFILIRVMA